MARLDGCVVECTRNPGWVVPAGACYQSDFMWKGGIHTYMRIYAAPKLVEFGRVQEVTLGASGASPDAIILSGGQVAPDNTNTTCINNVGSGYCYHL